MKTYFTSDYHFCHKNILIYDKRPFDNIQDHDKKIIENHNSVVKPEDEVWFLGDFIFGSESQLEQILKQMNGKIHIVFGNHDKAARKCGNLFDSQQDYKEINVNGQAITLCHYAFRVWNKSHHKAWMLYGHSHLSLTSLGKSMDVGIMGNNYFPYSFDDIKRIMDSKTISNEDHHKS